MAKGLPLLVLTFVLSTLQSRAQFTSVAFSVQAHADDFQLFMSSKLVADLNVSGRKMVIITLTAGDGGVCAASYAPSGVPFYLAREKGSVYSSKLMADLTTGTAPLDAPAATTVTVNGKSITKYTYKNTINYFFRLPDGNGAGEGFACSGNKSLQKLRAGTITSISVVGQSSAAYTFTWSELTATIKQIITNEKVTGTQSWIHAAWTTAGSYNSGDHSDHLYSSWAAQDAVATGMSWVGVNGFSNYASTSLGANLSATDHENATAFFALNNWGLIESEYVTTFAGSASHLYWLPMDWFQVLKTPSGNAPFAGTNNEPAEELKNSTDDKISMTEIPMIVKITSPVFIDKNIAMVISPYELGKLTTILYDSDGNQLYDLTTHIEKKEALFINLDYTIKTKGTYTIKTILNNKFIESRKIIAE